MLTKQEYEELRCSNIDRERAAEAYSNSLRQRITGTPVAERMTDARTALIRTFDTGATRSPSNGKPEYAGYLSPVVIREFGRYMLKHQTDSAGDQRDSRNWQKGIPLEAYMQSMFRHFFEVWSNYEANIASRDPDDDEEMIEALMALLFNVQGMAHEIILGEP